jgi:uncharacterized LabA/DUF88 family protein
VKGIADGRAGGVAAFIAARSQVPEVTAVAPSHVCHRNTGIAGYLRLDRIGTFSHANTQPPTSNKTSQPRTPRREAHMSVPSEKIALFIDGANLYATAKSLGFDIDYKRLLREFQSRGYLLRAFYYTAVVEDQEYSSIRPLIDWLDYNGYTVVTKATKEFVDQTGRRKVKGNMDIELAVDAMEIAGHVDHIVLFSGDGDFRSLVEAVQRRGVRVTVVSTISTQPPMVADELRRQADIFQDIVELQPKIGRDPSERAPREPREPRHAGHTPQFLQRGTTPQRAPASTADDDDFED